MRADKEEWNGGGMQHFLSNTAEDPSAQPTPTVSAHGNRADIGTIEVGKLADAVVYSADPLGPVGSTLHIDRVIKGGVLYTADSLRAEFRNEYDARVRQLWTKRLVLAVKVLVPLTLLQTLLIVFMRRRRKVSRGASA